MVKRHDFEPFTVHVPPNIEYLFGYQYDKQWVAFFWDTKEHDSNQGYVFDGRTFKPMNILAWDTFFNHILIIVMNHERERGRARKKFEFGDSYIPSEYWLVLDRHKRYLYAAPRQSAEQSFNNVLQTNQPQPILNSSSLSNNLALAQELNHGSNGALQLINDMVHWLDKRIKLLSKNGHWPKL